MNFIFKLILMLSTVSNNFQNFFINFFSYIHNKSYLILGVLVREKSGGIHPKIHIIDYVGWFSGYICDTDIVLDVGSNRGYMAAQLAGVAKQVIAIEIDKSYHDIAVKSYSKKNLEFINADATSYAFTNVGQINVITLSNVLEHIDKRIDFLKSLKRNVNWRNNQGRILIRVPSVERDWLAMYKLKNGLDYRLDRTHFIEYTETQLRNELEEAGLVINDLTTRWGEFYVVCDL